MASKLGAVLLILFMTGWAIIPPRYDPAIQWKERRILNGEQF